MLAIGFIQAVLIDRMNIVAAFALKKIGLGTIPKATNARLKFEFSAAAWARARTDAVYSTHDWITWAVDQRFKSKKGR
jgi:hypothetical protein